ncbi:hypothetical protein R5R35_012533 [Gryllus longicercus]|uniref:Lipase domain-containing protein n=1 Tax=Gryllus longicercus TaxID=2509291 RepID=A0AAN9V9Q3_9ORTH
MAAKVLLAVLTCRVLLQPSPMRRGTAPAMGDLRLGQPTALLLLVLLTPGNLWQPASAAAAPSSPVEAVDPDFSAPAPPAPAARPRPRPFVVSVPPAPAPSAASSLAPQEPLPGGSWTEREADAAPTSTPNAATDAATEWTTSDDVWTTELSADDAMTETATDAPGTTTAPVRAEPVLFLLYTRAHPLTPVVLRNDSLEGSDFDVARSTVFVLHGFTGDSVSDSVTLVRDALLWAEEANVVAVDWAPLAAGPKYAEAVDNTRTVARALAGRVAALAAAGLPLAQVHLLGFSLGAQVAGQAGALLAQDPRAGRPARITALDPARPGFTDVGEAERLDAADADFVAVLHTAAGIVSFEEPLGHADFYPNGGRSPQPACAGQPVHVVCSHLIAPRYFAESVYHARAFRGVRCRSWRDYEAGLCAGGQEAFLGPHLAPSTRGTFFLRTNAQEPFGRGQARDEAGTTSAPDDYEDGVDDNRVDARSARQREPPAKARAPAHSATASAALLLPLMALLAARHATR